MLYCLDTNAVSDFLAKKYNVETNMRNALKDRKNSLAICPIVHYEILRGLKLVPSKNKSAEFMEMYNNEMVKKLPFDYAAAEVAAEIYYELHKGNQIEDNDIYIAAVAIVNNCTLVTANEKHFRRIADLKVENWR